jgi:hypothetical protein
MQQLGISAQLKRSHKPTTKSDPHARLAPNPLNRQFSAEQPNTWNVSMCDPFSRNSLLQARGWLART